MSESEDTTETVAGSRAGVRSLLWLPLSGLLIVIDQLTKAMIVERLNQYERITVLPVFDIVRFHNTGAAFSLLADAGGWQNWFFTGVAVLVSFGILWYLWALPPRGARTLALGLALVLSGAIGNLIDRLSHGYVVDFLLFHYQEWAWPAFNVADSAITVGIALIVIDSLFFERRRRLNSESH